MFDEDLKRSPSALVSPPPRRTRQGGCRHLGKQTEINKARTVSDVARRKAASNTENVALEKAVAGREIKRVQTTAVRFSEKDVGGMEVRINRGYQAGFFIF